MELSTTAAMRRNGGDILQVVTRTIAVVAMLRTGMCPLATAAAGVAETHFGPSTHAATWPSSSHSDGRLQKRVRWVLRFGDEQLYSTNAALSPDGETLFVGLARGSCEDFAGFSAVDAATGARKWTWSPDRTTTTAA